MEHIPTSCYVEKSYSIHIRFLGTVVFVQSIA